MAAPIQYGQYSVPASSECVNFGVGQPAPSLLPLARVRAAAAAKLAEEDPLLLQVSGGARRSAARVHSSRLPAPPSPPALPPRPAR